MRRGRLSHCVARTGPAVGPMPRISTRSSWARGPCAERRKAHSCSCRNRYYLCQLPQVSTETRAAEATRVTVTASFPKKERGRKRKDEGGREKTRGPERDIANDVTQRSDIVSNPAESGWLRNMQRCVNAYCEQSRDAVTCSSAERERLVALMTTRKYTVGFRPRPPKHCKANCVFRLSLVRDRMVTRS